MCGITEKLYTVWVGGVEVVDHLLTIDEAECLAGEYELDGYEDVWIERVGRDPVFIQP